VKGPPPHVRVFNFFRNLVVGTSLTTLLLIGTAAFLFLAMDIPGMLAAGIPDRDIPAKMTRDFGFAAWPQLLRTIGYVVGWGALMLAAAVLIVSRRNTYGLHIVRGMFGVAVYTGSLLMTVNALHGSWTARPVAGPWDTLAVPGAERVMHGDGRSATMQVYVERDGPAADIGHPRRHDEDAERVATAFEGYIATARPQATPVAGGLALIGLVLMCWPARRSRDAALVSDDDAALPPAVENA
jgi:hypothetical protein